jgi:two-component system, OmpR family, phosphate regulon response regulator PhoB
MLPIRILVVEDNRDMAEIYRLTLQEQQFEVYLAHCVADAVGMLEAHRPDCILLDLTLPDGSEKSLESLRNHPALLSARVLVVSGRNDVAELANAYGAHGYLRKPFDMDDLVALLRP